MRCFFGADIFEFFLEKAKKIRVKRENHRNGIIRFIK